MIYPWLNIIAAMTEDNQVIGNNNELPWVRLKHDMKRFKRLTTNDVIIMGYNTFKSLLYRRLSNRSNLVLTRKSPDLLPANENTQLSYFDSIENILLATEYPPFPISIWVIGGAQVYQQFLPLANKLYLTVIHQQFEGDCYFPAIDKAVWQIESIEKIDNDIIPYSFQVWKRK